MQMKSHRPHALILKCLSIYHYKYIYIFVFLMSNVKKYLEPTYTLRYLLLCPFYDLAYGK